MPHNLQPSSPAVTSHVELRRAIDVNNGPAALRLGVAICTFRRPSQLKRLLSALAEQDLEPGITDVTVAIVDNSPDLEGLHAAREVQKGFRWPMILASEAIPGIAPTRNRTVQILLDHHAEAIAFIDDDERPSSQWLSLMLSAAVKFGSPMIAGPVLPYFDSPPPTWIIEGDVHQRRRYETGTEVGTTRTGNLLASAEVFRAIDAPWFDPQLALTGGEDSQFLDLATRRGFKTIWCNEAVVWEHISPERCTLPWLWRSRFGTSSAFVSRRLAQRSSALELASIVIKALIRASGSALAVLIVIPFAHWRNRALLSLSAGLGMLAGFFCVQVKLYHQAGIKK